MSKTRYRIVKNPGVHIWTPHEFRYEIQKLYDVTLWKPYTYAATHLGAKWIVRSLLKTRKPIVIAEYEVTENE